MIVFKTPKQHKKSAAEGGRLLRPCSCLLYNHFLRVQNKIYTYWVYLMEHIFFEVQLCIEISIFNEFCEIPTQQDIWELRQVIHSNIHISKPQIDRNWIVSKIQIQNLSFLNYAAKSQAPDRPIRSVSSSEYRRIPRGPKLTTFLGQKWHTGHYHTLWSI